MSVMTYVSIPDALIIFFLTLGPLKALGPFAKATLVAFDLFFEILPGTKPATTPASKPTKDEVFEDDAPIVKEP
jgi:hypothetical protein